MPGKTREHIIDKRVDTSCIWQLRVSRVRSKSFPSPTAINDLIRVFLQVITVARYMYSTNFETYEKLGRLVTRTKVGIFGAGLEYFLTIVWAIWSVMKTIIKINNHSCV